MSSVKRKAFESQLQRRVRARRDLSEELLGSSEVSEQSDGASGDEASVDHDAPDHNESEDSDDAKDSQSDDDSEPGDATSISFGALAKAQESIQRLGKKKPNSDLKKRKKTNDDTWEDNEAAERKAGRKDHRDFSRSNKNAPTEVSSKKAVSRKRDVVPIVKREYRDPRFEPLAGQVDERQVNKAYSFLDDYRRDEIKTLKEQIKKTKDESEKENMKRTLHSMESKMKAATRKAKEAEILDRHRKEEKKLVKEGKTPFYLKKAEQKKQFIMDQYSSLKGKQLDHVIERRRKKVEGKEKKNLPYARRDFGRND